MKKLTFAFIALVLVTACRAPEGAGGLPELALGEATSSPVPLPTPSATATLAADQLVQLAQDASNKGEWEIAIAFLDMAIAQSPENAQAFLLRGNAYKQLGNIDQALADYDQAIVLDVNMAAAFHNRGLIHSEQGNNEQALADFARAIELSPTFGLAYRSRAGVHLALGNSAAAALDLQIYLTFVPSAPDRVEVEAQIAALQEQTVAAAQEGLLFSDDFSDPETGWYTNGDPASIGLYAGDEYVLRITQSTQDGGIGLWAMPGRLFTDVRVEVTARKQSGSDNNFFGVICRLQGTNRTGSFYAFLISSDGYYVIGKRLNEGNLEGLDSANMLFSSLINQGEGSNTITAICDGPRLAFYVNGELLYEANDDDLSSGQVGLIAGTFDQPTSIAFDDFVVYDASQ